MNISKKCLYPMCNKHEDACKNDFKSCNDCAYLYKPGIASLFGNINKTGIYVLLISILVIAGFVVTKAVFRNHNEPSSSSAANKISSPAEETNKKIPGASKDKSETVLRIHGSNTIGTKLMPKLVEGYLEKKGATQIKITDGSNPQEKRVEFKFSDDEKTYNIEINSHGSKTAFKNLELATCDLGMTSMKINENEINVLRSAGLGDLSTLKCETIIAFDGVSIIVNKNNPISQLTVGQISDIFSGNITNWSQLGGKDGKIKVFSRDENSGTYDTFKNLILNDKGLIKDAVRIESAIDLTTEVSKDINAIGFANFSYTGDAKSIAISQGTENPVLPTAFNIATEEYYLSKRVYVYCPENIKNPYANEFVNYITDDEGQNIIKNNGFATIDIDVDENFKPFGKPTFKSNIAQQKYNQIVSNAQGRLSLNFLFKNGSYELDNKSIKDLEKVINFLYRNKYINSKILLVGYSDNKGDYNMNIKLSEQRALSVKEKMLKEFSLLDGRIDVLGMGPEMPISSNMTSGGKDRNRRVEVYIMKNAN